MICSHAEFLVENRSSRKPKRNGIQPLAHNGTVFRHLHFCPESSFHIILLLDGKITIR